MSGFICPVCTIPHPHDHGFMQSSESDRSFPAIIYRSEDPRAEVRDSETGEVIFPAVKGPLNLIEGGKQ